MKAATAPDAAYITATAMMTAAIITSMSCAMPIAVTIEFDREHQIDHDDLQR